MGSRHLLVETQRVDPRAAEGVLLILRAQAEEVLEVVDPTLRDGERPTGTGAAVGDDGALVLAVGLRVAGPIDEPGEVEARPVDPRDASPGRRSCGPPPRCGTGTGCSSCDPCGRSAPRRAAPPESPWPPSRPPPCSPGRAGSPRAMSLVRSARSVGPNMMQQLTPWASQSSLRLARACLMTPRSALLGAAEMYVPLMLAERRQDGPLRCCHVSPFPLPGRSSGECSRRHRVLSRSPPAPPRARRTSPINSL